MKINDTPLSPTGAQDEQTNMPNGVKNRDGDGPERIRTADLHVISVDTQEEGQSSTSSVRNKLTASYWERFTETYEGTEQIDVVQHNGRPMIVSHTKRKEEAEAPSQDAIDQNGVKNEVNSQ